ncbi:uncharacterized protein LOC144706437 [Wolffia australiana]
MAQQPPRSLREEYGLKSIDAVLPPPTPPPSPSVQISEENQIEAERRDPEQDGSEEQEECGFCLFMKGGGCKESFVAWELCMQEAESKNEDLVEKCHQVTGRLMECMQEHADYYEPILRAEKAMKEEVAHALERESNVEPSDGGTSAVINSSTD